MRNTTKILTAATAILLAVPFTSALAQRRRGLVDVSPSSDRHGFWLNAGAGAGIENYRFDTGDWHDDQSAPSLWLGLGGTVNPHLRLGGEFNLWVHEHTDKDSGLDVTETLGSAMLTGQVYPSRTLGFFIKGGLGISRSGSDISGPGGSVGETGFAGLAGIGYEIRLSRSVFLSPVVSGLWHTSGDREDALGKLHERVWTIGVGVTVQPDRW